MGIYTQYSIFTTREVCENIPSTPQDAVTRKHSRALLITQRQHNPRHSADLVFQRRPVQHECLEAHVGLGAKLEVKTDWLAHLECTSYHGLVIRAHGAGSVIGEEFEDVASDGRSKSAVGSLRFDGKEQIEDAGRSEGDEEAAVVYYDVLEVC